MKTEAEIPLTNVTHDPNQQTPEGRSRGGRAIVRAVFSDHLIWPIVVVMLIGGIFVNGFLSSGNLLNLLGGAAPLGCMVIGLYFVMMTGRLDLSLESTFALAPAIAVLFMTRWIPGLDPALALMIAVVVGALVGLLNGVLSIYFKVNPFLVTLATLLALRGVVVFLIPEGVYNLPPVFSAPGAFRIGGVFPLAIVILLVLFALAYAVMRHTTFGRSVTAIGNNEAATRVSGINVSAVTVGAFVIAGVCAAIGGVLQAGRLYSVDASMGEGSILIVFAAVTLGGTSLTGGRGKVTGLLGALFVIGGITNLMNLIGVVASLQDVVFGVVLLIAILLASIQDRLRGTN